ncbi:MAG TPA: sigma-70 family RNA polymerase sigma factor, partial [Acidimicrobiales bacterium]|nr:sigma-70 family RNA polymerase sigma factor [Acidimicrobiales bacterium]
MDSTAEEPDVSELVMLARRGDEAAWGGLVALFQDVAVAIGLGYLGDPVAAQDAAQEAFVLAATHLGDLREPAAFAGWFVRLARTACTRRLRASRPTVPLDESEPDSDVADPAEVVLAAAEHGRLRAAVEVLPAHERVVVALHYLGGLTYPETARFLGVSESTVRKRSHSARARLKEAFPMTADALTRARPSRSERFRQTVALFGAIRRRDLQAVARLIEADPGLAVATEDWSPEEAALAALPPARRASALIRAVQTADLDLVRVLVEAGAPVGELCQCQGGESPLWTASVGGDDHIVEYLLGQGADPNAAAFAGATPLHAAVQRGHHQVARRLLKAGADPERRDAHGRTPADWALLDRGETPPCADDDFVATGILALDLFSPIRRGGLTYWPAAVGIGQMVTLAELSDGLAPAHCWWTGFAHGPADRAAIEHGLHESGLSATLRLVPSGPDPTARRQLFQAAVDELLADRKDKFTVIQTVPGHEHDVTLAVAELRSASSVVAVAVVEPFTQTTAPGSRPPEGFHCQVTFDRRRARANLWPAIDPDRTIAIAYPSAAHERLATDARNLLDRYSALDPELILLSADTTPDPGLARRAQALIEYLVQPFRCAEPFTSSPAERTSYPHLLQTVDAILNTDNAPG